MSPYELNSGDTAWMLTSAAFVLLMTPGLALFYGGMVRAKSVLNMMMMSFGALALISVLWVLYGYSMAFGNDVGLGLLGNPTEFLGLKGLMADTDSSYPAMAFVAFQAVFAIITVALISGAIADRAKFGTWLIFSGIWATLVYFPIAHWVFDFSLTDDSGAVTHVGGWIANTLVAIDFAGGTAVHINAGAEGTFGLLGTEDSSVGLIIINTLGATAAAIIGWVVVEKFKDGKSTSVGAASGAVAGLVAITPSCANLTPGWALLLGLITGAICALAIELKWKLGYDDSLDVVGVHLVGGLWGTLAVGLLATAAAPAGVNGLFYGGGLDQLWRQAVGAFTVLIVSFVLTYAIGTILQKTIGFRVSREDELQGIDMTEHAESGYDLTPIGAVGRGVSFGGTHKNSDTTASRDQEVTA